MWEYLVRRLGQSLLTIFLVTIVSFGVMHAAPGGPITMLESPKTSAVSLEQKKKNLGLDQPVHIQYARWLGRMVQGDFGKTFISQRPVLDLIKPALKNTLILMTTSWVLTLLIAIPWGIMNSTRPYGLSDNMAAAIGYAGFAMPAFFFGILLQMYFAQKLGWFPLSDMHSMSKQGQFLDLVHHMVLPVFTLTTISLASYLKYARSSMMEVLGQDYVRTARAKGVPERTVIFRHALRNALIPIITILGLALPGIVAGAALTETVFNWPGMGRQFVEFAIGREYSALMAITLIIAVVVIIGNLLADILYAVVDPRVRLGGKGASN
ncbi:MAG TPA: ABC transporter permease [Symbiobacteriaceae bacterium]|nr:ABC transporter permease [Symbiobacteriaceae bacterium]